MYSIVLTYNFMYNIGQRIEKTFTEYQLLKGK